MTRWEYMHIESFSNRIIKIDNKMLADTKYKDSARRVDAHNIELAVSEFLKEVGRGRWEVAGMCSASEDGKNWRMILKRPITD